MIIPKKKSLNDVSLEVNVAISRKKNIQKKPRVRHSKSMGNQFFPLNCLTLSWSSRKKSGTEKPKRKPRKKKLGAGSADPAGVAGCQEKIRRLGQQLQRHSSWPSRPSRPSTWRSLMIPRTTNRTFLVGQSNSKKLVKTSRSYGLNIKFDGLGSNRWSIYLERKSGLKDPWTVFLQILIKCQIHAL